MTAPPPDPIAKALAHCPAAMQDRLLEVRTLILAASDQPAIGTLTETLKWGQPAYQTLATGAGTTLRLGRITSKSVRCGLLVPCQSRVIDQCRIEAPELDYDGNRAALIPADGPLPAAALSRCITLALTYRLWK